MGIKAKIGLTLGVVLGGVAYMIVTTVGSGEALEYYKHVNEVMDRPEAWRDRRLQLHGNVVAGTIYKKKDSPSFLFGLHRANAWVDVSYVGLVPDTFKDCGEVVVRGRLVGDRRFVAEEISAKCPSKYDGKRQPGVCGEAHREQVLAHRERR